MKFTCPYCKEDSITGFSKYRSHSASPAVCGHCGKFSAEPTWLNSATGIAWTLLTWGSLLLGFMLQTWVPIILAIGIVFSLELAIFLKMPLRPISEVTVSKARVNFLILFLIIIGAGTVAAFFE